MRTDTSARTQTHTHAGTRMHTRTHSCTHKRTQTRTRTNMHTHAYAHACICTRMHMHTHKHANADAHAYAQAFFGPSRSLRASFRPRLSSKLVWHGFEHCLNLSRKCSVLSQARHGLGLRKPLQASFQAFPIFTSLVSAPLGLRTFFGTVSNFVWLSPGLARASSGPLGPSRRRLGRFGFVWHHRPLPASG